jgi:putative transposase
MPRPPRIDLPGVPQHLVIRGNNRIDIFHDDNDRTAFLRYLVHAARATGSDVHAFVLMTNHVHLLASAGEPGALSRLIQSVGRRYSHYVNRTHGRTGTLFEGRFRSCLVDSDRYLFACMRYIELNPVRAGMVRTPAEYAWSSFRRNAGDEAFAWIVPRQEYQALGGDADARGAAYRALFSRRIEDAELHAIRESARTGCPFGSSAFVERVETALGRAARVAPRGRPRSREKCI